MPEQIPQELKTDVEGIPKAFSKYRLAELIGYGSVSSILTILQSMKMDVYGLSGINPSDLSTKIISSLPPEFLNNIGNANIPTVAAMKGMQIIVGIDILSKFVNLGLEISGVASDKAKKVNKFLRNSVSYAIITALTIGNCDAETLQVLPYQLIDKSAHLFANVPDTVHWIRPGTADVADLVAGFVGIMGAALWFDALNTTSNLSDNMVSEAGKRVREAYVRIRNK